MKVHVVRFELRVGGDDGEILNYYYGKSEKDGSFSVMTASSDPAPWSVMAKKDGYKETAARYEAGQTSQELCMQPE